MIVETGGADARLGPIIGLPLLLEELGVAPALAFRQAGVSLELFADADNRVSGEAVFGLLGVCANLSGRSDFGLLLGSRFTLADLLLPGCQLSGLLALPPAARSVVDNEL